MKHSKTHIKKEIRELRDQLSLPPFLDLDSTPMDLLTYEYEMLRYLAQFESATTTLSKLLINDGIALPHPDSLALNQLPTKLWQVIEGMANYRHFLMQTDHLNDYELYSLLWNVILNEETHQMEPSMVNCACYIDMAEAGDQEGIEIFLQYYADQQDRLDWQDCYPFEDLPPKLPRLNDRDSRLPQPEMPVK